VTAGYVYHHFRGVAAAINPDSTDTSTPKFANHEAHILDLCNANDGNGFPYLSMDHLGRRDPRPAGGLKGILAEVATEWGMRPEDILQDSRKKLIVEPRQDFMWRARQVRWPDGSYRYSLPMIAAFLRLKDHTTVMHGVRRHEARMAELASAA
jgi:hypothetical protein